MMSFRTASTLLTGAFAVSPYAGLGVLGANVPTGGDHGPSPLLNDDILPASEYAWELVTPPSAGVLTLYPDGSFVWDTTGVADGIYAFVYRLYEDGIDSGTGTVYLSVGTSSVSLVVADLNHGHALDSAVLSLPVGGGVDLVVGDLSHAHALEAVVLDAPLPGVTNLAVADLLHGHSLDMAVLGFYGSVDLVVADVAHGHTADNVGLWVAGDTTLTTADLAAIDALIVARIADIAAATLAAAQVTPIYSNMMQTNNEALIGDGTEGNKFRSHLVP